RAVEELDERRHRFEYFQELGIEAAAGCERDLVLARAEELLELQVMSSRMILRIAKRDAGQTIAGQFADRSRECGSRHHLMQPAWMRCGDLRANVVQVGG